MVVSADDIDTITGGNSFISMAGAAEVFLGNGIDVTTTEMSIGLSEKASIRAATAEVRGTDAVELASMGAAIKMTRDAGSQMTSMQLVSLNTFDEFQQEFEQVGPSSHSPHTTLTQPSHSPPHAQPSAQPSHSPRTALTQLRSSR